MFVLALASCKKEEVIEVSFRIKAQGFSFENPLPGEKEAFPTFSHRLSGGFVTFTNTEKTYSIALHDKGIEEYSFLLPVGSYEVYIRNPDASIYGQERGSFHMEKTNVEILVSTDTLIIQVVASCALVLVEDESGQLEEGAFMIERHSYAHGFFTSYPLSKDSLTGLYYTYFTPDPVSYNPSAFLWFYEESPGESEGGMPTFGFENGYQYHISILE